MVTLSLKQQVQISEEVETPSNHALLAFIASPFPEHSGSQVSKGLAAVEPFSFCFLSWTYV